jgi:hypothetical protein
MKRLILALCIAFSAIGAGCVTAGTEMSAPSFDDRVKFAQKQAIGILKACTALLDAGRMSADEGQQCFDFVKEVKAAIDAARLMSAGDQQAQLMAITQALLHVESFLQSRLK